MILVLFKVSKNEDIKYVTEKAFDLCVHDWVSESINEQELEAVEMTEKADADGPN